LSGFFPLSDVAWKRVDYIWLIIALLGVLASSGRASHEFTKAEIPLLEPVTNLSFQTLRHDIEFGASPGSEGCAPRIHTSFSPPDYDDIRKAQQHLCEQFRKLDSEVPKSPGLGGTKFAALDQLKFQPLSEDELSLKYESRDIERLKADAARYEKDRQIYNAKLEEERDQEGSPLILMDLGIGPLLVGIAIAIRLTKTAGEIRNKKEADSQTPTITTVSPRSAIAGTAGLTLTVNGTNFVSGSTVSFNGNAQATTFVSATQLTAAILASDVATAGIFKVTVTNPGGGASNAASFTV
jgi:IPT/TIG domain